jgi:hypothetical protein
LYLHATVGVILAVLIKVPLDKASTSLMLPLASIFVGLTFAWSGNAQALLQDEKIEMLAEHHPDGIENYIYTFQTAVLVILLALVAWGLAGLEIFDNGIFAFDVTKFLSAAFMYFLSSLSLRECWQVVFGGQLLLLSRHTIKKKTTSNTE